MRTIIALLLLCPTLVFSQKLKVNEIDKFTHQKRLQTERKTLKSRLIEGLSVYFRSVDSTVFVILEGYGSGADVIGEGDKAIFLLSSGATVTAYSTGIQDYTISSGANTFHHQYRLNTDALLQLSKSKVTSIRKYAVQSYTDIEIPEKNQGDIGKLATLMLGNL